MNNCNVTTTYKTKYNYKRYNNIQNKIQSISMCGTKFKQKIIQYTLQYTLLSSTSPKNVECSPSSQRG